MKKYLMVVFFFLASFPTHSYAGVRHAGLEFQGGYSTGPQEEELEPFSRRTLRLEEPEISITRDANNTPVCHCTCRAAAPVMDSNDLLARKLAKMTPSQRRLIERALDEELLNRLDR